MADRSNDTQVQFQAEARAIYFSLFQAFEADVSHLDRQAEEYRFQQLKNQYLATLKQRLEEAASLILKKSRAGVTNTAQMNQLLHQQVMDYLHGFVKKTAAL